MPPLDANDPFDALGAGTGMVPAAGPAPAGGGPAINLPTVPGSSNVDVGGGQTALGAGGAASVSVPTALPGGGGILPDGSVTNDPATWARWTKDQPAPAKPAADASDPFDALGAGHGAAPGPAAAPGGGNAAAVPATPTGPALKPGQATGYLANIGAGTGEAVAGLLGLPVDLVTGIINLGARGINKLAGTKIPPIENPVGGSQSIQEGFGHIAPTANPQNVIPGTPGEALARAGARGVTSMVLPGAGEGAPLRAGLETLGVGAPMAGAVGDAMATGAAPMGAAAGGVGGVTGEAARQSVPPEYQQMADAFGNIVGGGLVAGATAGLNIAGRVGLAVAKNARDAMPIGAEVPIIDPNTNQPVINPKTGTPYMARSGQANLAGRQIVAASGQSPADLVADTAGASGLNVPGSTPSMGQMTGNMQLLKHERLMRGLNPIPFNEAEAANAQAQVNALNSGAIENAGPAAGQFFAQRLGQLRGMWDRLVQAEADGARHRAENLTPTAQGAMSDQALGDAQRKALDALRPPIKGAIRRLYDAVDPDGTLAVNVKSIQDKARELLGGIDEGMGDELGPEAGVLKAAAGMNDVELFSRLRKLDSNLSAKQREIRTDPKLGAESQPMSRVNQLRDAIDAALIDAAERQARSSAAEGRVTDSPGFRDWFKGSKVTDASGAPLRVFHGTRGDFQDFDPEQVGSNTGAHVQGFVFTDNPALADQYAKKGLGEAGFFGGGNVRPAHLNMQKPFEFDFSDPKAQAAHPGLHSPDDVASFARSNGFDGAIVKGFGDGRGSGTQYFVFKPEQIRSATTTVGDRLAAEAEEWRQTNSPPGSADSGSAGGVSAGGEGGVPGVGGAAGASEGGSGAPGAAGVVEAGAADGGTSRSSAWLKPRSAAEIAAAGKTEAARRGDDVLSFIIRRGGVKDEGGDIKAMGGDLYHHRGAGRLINNTSGQGLDYIREAMEEEGLLPKGSDINAARNKIGEALDAVKDGRRLYSDEEQVEADAAARQRSEASQTEVARTKARDEVLSVEEEHGLRLTPAAIDHAVDLRMQVDADGHQMHPEEAVRQAVSAQDERLLNADTAKRAFGAPGVEPASSQSEMPLNGFASKLKENFTQAARNVLREANRRYAIYKDTFRRGAVGTVLQSGKGPGGFSLADSSVPRTLFKPGPGGAEAIDSLIKAAGSPEAAETVLGDYPAFSFRRAAEKDGQIDPVKAQKWIDQHKAALDKLPTLGGKFQDVQAATQSAAEAADRGQKAIKAYQDGASRYFLQKNGLPIDEPSQGIKALMGSKTGLEDARALVQEVRTAGDQGALDGLRRAAIDHVLARVRSVSEAGVSGEKGIKGNVLQGMLQDPKQSGILRTILGDPTFRMLESIGDDLEMGARAWNATRIPGSPSSASDLFHIAQHTLGSNVGIAGQIALGTIMGQALEGGLASLSGSGILIGAATAAGNALRLAGLRDVDDLVTQGLLNPDLGRVLASKVQIAKNPEILKTLLSRIAALGVSGSAGANHKGVR